MISDFIVSISLMILFVYKLGQVSNALLNYHMDDEHLIDRKQNKLFNIISKQTILTIFGTISTQIWLWVSLSMVIIYQFDGDNYQLKYCFYTICGISFGFDCCVNTLMVFLGFSYFSNVYDKTCIKCHMCCYKCFKKVPLTEFMDPETIDIALFNK